MASERRTGARRDAARFLLGNAWLPSERQPPAIAPRQSGAAMSIIEQAYVAILKSVASRCADLQSARHRTEAAAVGGRLGLQVESALARAGVPGIARTAPGLGPEHVIISPTEVRVRQGNARAERPGGGGGGYPSLRHSGLSPPGPPNTPRKARKSAATSAILLRDAIAAPGAPLARIRPIGRTDTGALRFISSAGSEAVRTGR